jgi:hypothetical protein
MEHPSSVRFSSLQPLNRIPREPGIVLHRIPHLLVPPVHQILVGTAAVCHDLSTHPYFSLGLKGSVGWAGKPVMKWAWPIPTVPFLFFIIQN